MRGGGCWRVCAALGRKWYLVWGCWAMLGGGEVVCCDHLLVESLGWVWWGVGRGFVLVVVYVYIIVLCLCVWFVAGVMSRDVSVESYIFSVFGLPLSGGSWVVVSFRLYCLLLLMVVDFFRGCYRLVFVQWFVVGEVFCWVWFSPIGLGGWGVWFMSLWRGGCGVVLFWLPLLGGWCVF